MKVVNELELTTVWAIDESSATHQITCKDLVIWHYLFVIAFADACDMQK
jgi:hypothetical protein